MKSSKRRLWYIAGGIVAVLVACLCLEHSYRLFEHNFTSRDGESHLIYVYPETTLDSVISTIEKDFEIEEPWTLRLHAKWMKWTSDANPYVRTGCYRIGARASNISVIRMFRSGHQEPVKVSFSNVRTREQLAASLSSQLMLDSAAVASRLNDSTFMAKYDLTIPQAVCLFIPNTYELYWNISPDELFKRMHKEYKAFWNSSRMAKCKKMGLEPWEVVTLASIVEGETYVASDKPIVAGLYLNRLRKGMLLQACPTVIFAWQDFSIRRVLSRHLEIDSPYNTYKYRGLPPGPIRIPSIAGVDATLNYQESDYLFMCASAALDGSHHFSATYAEHQQYAREYQAEMNRRKIGMQQKAE